MNSEETRTLLEKGKEAWNEWALEILERKKALEDSGGWSADWFGEGQNPETEAWLAEAKANFESAEFTSDASFDSFVFPGPAIFTGAHFRGRAIFSNANFANTALFQNARFDGEANLKQAKFYDLANFDDAVFASGADFDKAEFLRETTGPLVPAARFQKSQFNARADFRSAKFVGNAEYIRAHFGGNARFDEAEFQADATFEGVVFEGTVGLVKTRFAGAAKFIQAQLRSEARLGEAEFQGNTSFEEVEFTGKVTSRSAKFGGDTTFQAARFAKEARFNETNFGETVIVQSAKFADTADFSSVTFAKAVDFYDSTFSDDAIFDRATFWQSADFPSAKFKVGVSFAEAEFHSRANFLQTIFRGRSSFRRVKFHGPAEFAASRARGAFVLSGADFAQVPSFHDTTFGEPPTLNDMTIADPLCFLPGRNGNGETDPRPALFRAMRSCGDPEYAARYGRLHKLASQTQDSERAREFFAQELRCRRFWHDRPLGRGLARFWIGWLYGGISDFGRSIVRPLTLWVVTVLVFSLIYLGLRRSDYFGTAPAPIAHVAPLFPAWPADPNFGAALKWAGSALGWFVLSIFNLFAGGGCVSGDTGATGEALFLSLKNSLLFFGWESPDVARRVYGCLYGFEPWTGEGERLVRVPLSVSTVAIIENVIGITLILLCLFAVRNLLRAR
jgi:uncharacterized protein YjbI with pentapeptide repeats